MIIYFRKKDTLTSVEDIIWWFDKIRWYFVPATNVNPLISNHIRRTNPATSWISLDISLKIIMHIFDYANPYRERISKLSNKPVTQSSYIAGIEFWTIERTSFSYILNSIKSITRYWDNNTERFTKCISMFQSDWSYIVVLDLTSWLRRRIAGEKLKYSSTYPFQLFLTRRFPSMKKIQFVNRPVCTSTQRTKRLDS